jgi:DNA modification methylase
MVFTDPPYGINYQDVKHKHKKIKNDSGVSIKELLTLLPNDCPIYVCCSWQSYPEYYSAIDDIKALIVWDKRVRIQNLDKFFKQHEFIIYKGDFGGQKTVDGDGWQIDRETRVDHPTSKPVALISKALEYSSKVGQSVLDLFGGSGSTLIACEKLNRRCYMMELDEHYCDVIIKRFEDFTGHKAELING